MPSVLVSPAYAKTAAIQVRENAMNTKKLAELPDELNCRNGSETAISMRLFKQGLLINHR
ncbi:MAG: hypothetical protein ABEK10_02075 [Candidatus Nanosalina sp.]